MQQTLRMLLTVVLVILALIAGHWVWNYYLYAPWTRDGKVRAEIITLSPDVSGWVRELNIEDNQRVSRGDPLFRIDDTRYQAALAKARAQLLYQQKALQLAQHHYQRRKDLHRSNNNSISKEALESARIQAELAKANVALAQAELDSASINLERTRIHAPADGTIVNLSLQQGNFVNQGSPVLSLVKADSFYVTGYFEETKLPLVHVGQDASVILMNGSRALQGKVTSVGQAIANANTQTDRQLLPQVQQTFNWVRLAQRIPVHIKLASVPKDILLAAGMTATVRLYDEEPE
ncbi:MAG: secretion protein HylD [Alcanivorax borkumensis]|jgi:RND family efflux transporter MFP subunit|uniref:Efflux transporter, membrane fusion protein, putative n=1 Tax=Alcanivorax borkumensis (strain ATCC 700651 / DSM 11573 / NCIMB 13689 / SK2) TaxID=393595 RepID=Q0VQG4_ALCBS|nr:MULTISPECIES: HlyD family secretion protein [Alcanivorax]OJH07658.1 MAG: secretion protein HylD [Alcanivorax borkumensis]EUC71424.1 secretion protein HylD [Alcanivorax sp. 97CO-5]PKG02851.1 HlyD family secretion protein [Alcanivorax sp. 97CO-6]CAL16584.1 efflux transporter, membrane fusion protein, putative [Alcanivorax borkumensis SK2]BAP14055.1 putative efflux transporter [Alcanivorax sp. NBRC 101098]